MCKLIIDKMVDVGSVVEWDEQVWMNCEVNFFPEHEAFGCKITQCKMSFVMTMLLGLFWWKVIGIMVESYYL